MLMAHHAEYAPLTPDAGSKALSHFDSSMFSWGKFWPILADMSHTPAGRPADDPAANATVNTPCKTSPRVFGGPGVVLKRVRSQRCPRPGKDQANQGLTDSLFGGRARVAFGLIDGT
jgi:hypothetical protein